MKNSKAKRILLLFVIVCMMSLGAVSVSASDEAYQASNDFTTESSTAATAVDGIYMTHGYGGMAAAVGTNMTYEADGYYKMNNLGSSVNPCAIHLGALEPGKYTVSVDVKLAEAVSGSAQLTATLNVGAHDNNAKAYQYTEVSGMSMDNTYNRYAVASSSEDFPTTDTWKTFELKFEVPENDARTDWVVSIGNQNVATYIDNVVVEEEVEAEPEPEGPYQASNDFTTESSTVATAVDGIYMTHGYSGMAAAVGTNMTYEADGYYKMKNLGSSVNPCAIHLGALEPGKYTVSVDVKLAEAVSGSAQLTATLNVGAHGNGSSDYQYTEVTDMEVDDAYNRYHILSSSEDFPTTDTWKTFGLKFEVPENDARTDWVVSIGNQNVATYIDNVVVNETTATQPEEPDDPVVPDDPTDTVYGDLGIASAGVKVGSNAIYSVADMAGNTVTFTTTVYNNTTSAKEGLVITAVYDANNVMVGVGVAENVTQVAASGDTIASATATTTVDLTAVASTADCYVRTYIWSDLDDIAPYALDIDPFECVNANSSMEITKFGSGNPDLLSYNNANSGRLTIAQSDEDSRTGIYSAKCVATNGYGGLRTDAKAWADLGGEGKYQATCYVKVTAGTDAFNILARDANGNTAGTTPSAQNINSASNSGWVELKSDIIECRTGETYDFCIRNLWNDGSTYYVDDFVVQRVGDLDAE